MRKNYSLELQTEAWNLWKEICSITGCSPTSTVMQKLLLLHPEKKKVSQECFEYLSNVINGIFKSSLRMRCPIVFEEKKWQRKDISCCLDFDFLMREDFQKRDPYEETEIRMKAYKDVLWSKVRLSHDPAPQVIVGQLKFLMLKLIIYYLKENYQTISAADYIRFYEHSDLTDEEKKDKIKRCKNSISLIPTVSLDAPAGNDDECGNWEQFIAAPASAEDDNTAGNRVVKAFYDGLDTSEKLMLIGLWGGLNATGEQMQQALERKKSVCGEIHKSLKQKISAMRSFPNDSIKLLKKMILNEFRTEKKARALLLMVVKRSEEDLIHG